jgi:TonB family protein
MNRPPHPLTKPFLLAVLAVCALSVFSGVGSKADAQQPNSQELYGTAKRYFEAGAYRKALDAIEDVLKMDADYAPALRLKARTLIGLFVETPPLQPDEMNSPEIRRERKMRQAKLLKEAAESLERFLQLKPETEGAEGLREQLDTLRVYAEPAIKPESEWTIFSQGEVTERAHILSKPPPRYPEEARAARLNGSVKLLLVLAADGTVKHPFVLQSSGRVLTEAAFEAARKIRFEPAIKDGHPVSTVSSVEYNFQTY